MKDNHLNDEHNMSLLERIAGGLLMGLLVVGILMMFTCRAAYLLITGKY